MESTRNPTLDEIHELVSFLPILYADGYEPVTRWEGGKQKDGTFTLPYPIYDDAVDRFFKTASGEQWADYGYIPENASQMIQNDELVKSASMSEIKTMLTYCVRGERFSDGHWEEMIKNGYIRKILERLVGIEKEMKTQ